MSKGWARVVFALAALYDGLLGIGFLLAGSSIFSAFNVPPPNHMGYVHFSAALLLIFGLMFLAIALRPVANRHLIRYGALLKIAYCGVALTHWISGGIPFMWKPFILCDLAFLVAFVWAWWALRPSANRQ